MPEDDVPYVPPGQMPRWATDMLHQPRPNVVPAVQVPAPPRITPAAPAAQRLPAGVGTAMVRPPAADPQAPQVQPSYYDISMLKAPVWKWHIAGYFFFGGLSAGAYVLARLAERAGGEKYRELTRLGTYTALLSFLPCPPLLILDLGDPKRFHHMLRVWKPSSPMNLGTWTIVAYSGMAATAVIREYLRDHPQQAPRLRLPGGMKTALLALHDAAGVPFALLVAGYTGVLLNSTSNPLWCRNGWLGPLFTASSVATGAEAVMLALGGLGRERRTDADAALAALARIDTVAHAAEVACLKGFEQAAGEKARPLKQGKMKQHMQLSKGCLYAAEALKFLPLPPRLRRGARLLSAALGLLSGFSLRWAMVYGGAEAANDPQLARLNSRRETEPSAGELSARPVRPASLPPPARPLRQPAQATTVLRWDGRQCHQALDELADEEPARDRDGADFGLQTAGPSAQATLPAGAMGIRVGSGALAAMYRELTVRTAGAGGAALFDAHGTLLALRQDDDRLRAVEAVLALARRLRGRWIGMCSSSPPAQPCTRCRHHWPPRCP